MIPSVAHTHRVARSRALPTVALLLIALTTASCGFSSVPHSAASPSSSSSTPTALPVPPNRPMVSITRAWGSKAPTATFSTQLDASYIMHTISLAPDGRSLYGYELKPVPNNLIATNPAQAGVLDIASHHFKPIGVASLPKCPGTSCEVTGNGPIFLNCCQTDGRFLIAQSTGYPARDCGGCVYAYDQSTSALFQPIAAKKYQVVSPGQVDHGILVADTALGIVIADLTKRTIKLLPGTAFDTPIDAFTWPYLVYGTAGDASGTTVTFTPLTVYDVTTGATTPLPQVVGNILALRDANLYYVATSENTPVGKATLNELDNITSPGAEPRILAALPTDSDYGLPHFLGIVGGSLFYSIRSGQPGSLSCHPGMGVGCPIATPATPLVTMLYEVDNHGSGTPDVRPIASYAANLGDVIAANDRLVVLNFAAWDRAEGRFVDLGTDSDPNSNDHPSLQDAKGDFLLIARSTTNDWDAPFQVSIYDATRLPVLTN